MLDPVREAKLPGYAIGGLSGGEEKSVFWRIVAQCARRLPENKPKYTMGVGYSEGESNIYYSSSPSRRTSTQIKTPSLTCRSAGVRSSRRRYGRLRLPDTDSAFWSRLDVYRTSQLATNRNGIRFRRDRFHLSLRDMPQR